MEAALSAAGRVTPLHGASEAALGQLEQPACDAEVAVRAERAEDELGAVAGAGLQQALQDKVQQQAAQLQQQAALLRDALRHKELLASASTTAATAGTADTAAASGTADANASARPLVGAAGTTAPALVKGIGVHLRNDQGQSATHSVWVWRSRLPTQTGA